MNSATTSRLADWTNTASARRAHAEPEPERAQERGSGPGDVPDLAGGQRGGAAHDEAEAREGEEEDHEHGPE
ncbi:hypothetical protein [Actinomadura sp. 3N407]|uniref:hypothetical protein n=1 Tax=Actinomadura sp. 3N407 TaxID=3457423 RepID=UPI003FCE9A57